MTNTQLSETDNAFMRLALEQAHNAELAGEVPVGAVVIKDGQVIATGHNVCISQSDPSGHAEVVALRAAAAALSNYRLEGCTLYVTLEPCAMCAGAILHSRLNRVVIGAADPKAGACGSVVDVLGTPQLNHQTRVTHGVLEAECSAKLSRFFSLLRERRRAEVWPLREDALRTPEKHFQGLPAYPWEPHYFNDLAGLNSLRLHYLDEGPRDGPFTFLCLHGNPSWSYLYRKMIPVWTAAGHRVVVPDLIGFGKSDKPKRESTHSFELHRNYLLDLVERLDLHNVVLVVQDWGGILGLTLPMESPQRYKGLFVMNTLLATGDTDLSVGFKAWREMCAKSPQYDIARLFQRGNPQMSAEECAAYSAPFPDAGHRAATRAFPEMVSQTIDHPQSVISRAALNFWSENWTGTTLLAIGKADPVLGLEVMQKLRGQIKGCPEPLVVDEAGHFVPEHGVDIAKAMLAALSHT
jgi:tRNA(adenine34) deaminase